MRATVLLFQLCPTQPPQRPQQREPQTTGQQRARPLPLHHASGMPVPNSHRQPPTKSLVPYACQPSITQKEGQCPPSSGHTAGTHCTPAAQPICLLNNRVFRAYPVASRGYPPLPSFSMPSASSGGLIFQNLSPAMTPAPKHQCHRQPPDTPYLCAATGWSSPIQPTPNGTKHGPNSLTATCNGPQTTTSQVTLGKQNGFA